MSVSKTVSYLFMLLGILTIGIVAVVYLPDFITFTILSYLSDFYYPTTTTQPSITTSPPIQSPAGGLEPQTIEKNVFELLNEERKKTGAPIFVWNEKIAKVAREHSEDMALNNYLEYVNSKGQKLEDVLEQKAGARYCSTLIAKGYVSASAYVTNLMKDPKRKERILIKNVNVLGVGIAENKLGILHFTLILCDPRYIKTDVITIVDLGDIKKQVFDLVNSERGKANLDPLIWDDRLANVAREHSEDMIRNNFVGHINLKGQNVEDRLRIAGIDWNFCGENIAVGDEDAQSIVRGWMESKGHRDNVLQLQFRYSGVGIARSKAGNLYITQVFAKL